MQIAVERKIILQGLLDGLTVQRGASICDDMSKHCPKLQNLCTPSITRNPVNMLQKFTTGLDLRIHFILLAPWTRRGASIVAEFQLVAVPLLRALPGGLLVTTELGRRRALHQQTSGSAGR